MYVHRKVLKCFYECLLRRKLNVTTRSNTWLRQDLFPPLILMYSCSFVNISVNPHGKIPTFNIPGISQPYSIVFLNTQTTYTWNTAIRIENTTPTSQQRRKGDFLSLFLPYFQKITGSPRYLNTTSNCATSFIASVFPDSTSASHEGEESKK